MKITIAGLPISFDFNERSHLVRMNFLENETTVGCIYFYKTHILNVKKIFETGNTILDNTDDWWFFSSEPEATMTKFGVSFPNVQTVYLYNHIIMSLQVLFVKTLEYESRQFDF